MDFSTIALPKTSAKADLDVIEQSGWGGPVLLTRTTHTVRALMAISPPVHPGHEVDVVWFVAVYPDGQVIQAGVDVSFGPPSNPVRWYPNVTAARPFQDPV